MTTAAQPLTGQQWVEAVERIEFLWPGTKSYSSPKLFEVFREHPVEHVQLAISRLFDDGKQGAPSPSVLRSTIRSIASERGVSYDGPHECALGHVRPFYLYGGIYATERGPGWVECAIESCEFERPCHCKDECQPDRFYTRARRDATTEEMAEQRPQSVKSEAP